MDPETSMTQTTSERCRFAFSSEGGLTDASKYTSSTSSPSSRGSERSVSITSSTSTHISPSISSVSSSLSPPTQPAFDFFLGLLLKVVLTFLPKLFAVFFAADAIELNVFLAFFETVGDLLTKGVRSAFFVFPSFIALAVFAILSLPYAIMFVATASMLPLEGCFLKLSASGTFSSSSSPSSSSSSSLSFSSSSSSSSSSSVSASPTSSSTSSESISDALDFKLLPLFSATSSTLYFLSSFSRSSTNEESLFAWVVSDSMILNASSSLPLSTSDNVANACSISEQLVLPTIAA
mmetsp:Transcript_54244/g.86235  ORF Transcript_54244/g.86235 Transcript_54244/m.86235 type:complete len:293 (+) Transcript_54244:540-1418(+)